MVRALGWILLCYFIGSIPFSYIIGRALGKVDITTKGSGNVGATNVLRSTNVSVAIVALCGDVLKGVIAAWIGMAAGGPVLASWCGGAVVLGHCYSVFMRFKGGKGVATAAGVIGFLMPPIVVALASILVISVVITRYVSLGSVLAAAVFPIRCLVLWKPWPYIVLSFFLAGLVLYRHRENIRRLRSGQEARITDKAL